MVIKLRALCGESDDFLREYEIDGSDTFFDLHLFIQSNLNFDERQMASFFITDNGWNKEQEITLLDMSDGESSTAMLMEETVLSDLLKKAKQRLIYVFDLFSERALFLEVVKVDAKATLNEAICTVAAGVVPVQILLDDPSKDIDSVMYDDDSFDSLLYGGELDEDDFGGEEFGEGDGFTDDYGYDYE